MCPSGGYLDVSFIHVAALREATDLLDKETRTGFLGVTVKVFTTY
jgi:hypothetical protein